MGACGGCLTCGVGACVYIVAQAIALAVFAATFIYNLETGVVTPGLGTFLLRPVTNNDVMRCEGDRWEGKSYSLLNFGDSFEGGLEDNRVDIAFPQVNRSGVELQPGETLVLGVLSHVCAETSVTIVHECIAPCELAVGGLWAGDARAYGAKPGEGRVGALNDDFITDPGDSSYLETQVTNGAHTFEIDDDGCERLDIVAYNSYSSPVTVSVLTADVVAKAYDLSSPEDSCECPCEIDRERDSGQDDWFLLNGATPDLDAELVWDLVIDMTKDPSEKDRSLKIRRALWTLVPPLSLAFCSCCPVGVVSGCFLKYMSQDEKKRKTVHSASRQIPRGTAPSQSDRSLGIRLVSVAYDPYAAAAAKEQHSEATAPSLAASAPPAAGAYSTSDSPASDSPYAAAAAAASVDMWGDDLYGAAAPAFDDSYDDPYM